DSVTGAQDSLHSQRVGKPGAWCEVRARLIDVAGHWIIGIADLRLSELCILVTQSVIEAEVARDSPLILAVKVEIADENLRQHGPERLAVGLPAFASLRVREVLREVSNRSVCIGSDTVEQRILHVLRVRDIETELELVASPRPGEIVGKLK